MATWKRGDWILKEREFRRTQRGRDYSRLGSGAENLALFVSVVYQNQRDVTRVLESG